MAAVTPLSRNRDFQLLWTGQLVSTFGGWLSAVAMPLLLLDVTGSPFIAGFSRFAATLPLLVFFLPAGVAADRYDRRTTMIATEATRLVVIASVALAVVTGAVFVVHLIAAVFLMGVCATFFNVAEIASIPRIVPAAQRQQALAQNGMRFYVGLIVGQTAAGVLYAVGRAVPFVVDAVSYIASLVSILLIRTPLQEPSAVARRAPVREGLTWLWANDLLRTTMLLAAGNNFVVNSLYLVVIVLAQRDLHASSAEIGVMLASIGVSGVLGSIAAPHIAPLLTFRQVMVLTFGLKAALIPVLLVLPNAYAVGVVLGAMFFADATCGSVVGARQMSLIPDNLQGRVNGAMQLVSLGPVPIGALAAGASLEAIGAGATVLALGGLMLATTLACLASRTIASASSPEPPAPPQAPSQAAPLPRY